VFADRLELPGLASLFPVVASDASWCTTCSQNVKGSRERLRNLRSVMRTLRPSQPGAGAGQIDIGG
jgi:hypothetical protein